VPAQTPGVAEVKAAHADVKKGRVLSAKNERKLSSAAESLRSAADDIETVLDQVREAQENDDELASDPERKQLSSDVHAALREAGTERWGSSKRHVYTDDFDLDEGWAVYCIWSDTDGDKFIQVSYERQADGSIKLGTDETEVRRTTSYRPAS
jgi:hypothetical protein